MKNLSIFIAGCLLISMCVTQSEPSSHATVTRQSENEYGSIDKLLVVHFHRVHQCTCCINVGKWAEETIQKYFPIEFEQGRIVYMDVCIEETPELSRKYNAYGSSLFISIIKGEEETFTENMEVWTYCFDHDAYVDYFKNFLDSILTT
ncbi:MAG: hypothetical protein HXS53_09415 [Theionarchaea archaeon]|nr:hypothetical protein [Theionarchaea archaeon]